MEKFYAVIPDDKYPSYKTLESAEEEARNILEAKREGGFWIVSVLRTIWVEPKLAFFTEVAEGEEAKE